MKASAALVFAFALACYLPLLGDAPLAGTEGHRAVTAHQMVQSGQWLVPRLYDQIYLAKPPLHYWLLATFEKLSGRATPLVWRLPAAFEGAILAAVLCLFGTRWFGKVGGLVSGFSYVAMVTMWGENRGAELDATNTLPATLAALCLLELHFSQPKRRVWWMLGAGLFTAACIMAKAHAGLTIIFGVLVWGGVMAICRHDKRWFIRPSTWLPIAMGAVVLGAYAYAVYRFLLSHHLPIDFSGVTEGLQDLHPNSWLRILSALLLPVNLFLYAMPVSLALPAAWVTCDRDPARDKLSNALIASVLLAWGISVASGMHLPRYAFVTLPLLCPLAGAVAARIPQISRQSADKIRITLICTAIGFCAATIVLCLILHKAPATRAIAPLAILAALSTVIAATTIILLLRPNPWRGAWGLLGLILALSIPFAMLKNDERFHKTSEPQGKMLRSIVGTQAQLLTCMMVLDQPDLFYYSDVPTHAYDGAMLDWREVDGDHWVVLEEPELVKWNKEVHDRLMFIKEFVANKNKGYLIWYSPEHHPAPSTAPAIPGK